jgi:anti-sigma factor RsiW
MMRLTPAYSEGATGTAGPRGSGDCPLVPMVGRFCDDELDPFARRQFKLHLEQCPSCTDEVARVRQLSEWFAPVRALEPQSQLLGRLHDSIHDRGDFEGKRRIRDALPTARMLLALAASVLIVAGAWLVDGAGAPATPIQAPMSQRLAQAQPWERTALTLEVESPYDAGGLRPDQERLLDWMVASLDKPEQP